MDALMETGLISCFNYSGKYPGAQFIRKAEVTTNGQALDIDAVFKALFACPPPAPPVDDSLASTLKTLTIGGDEGKKELKKAEMANKPVEEVEKSMQLFIKTLTGKTVVIDAKPSDTVSSVKEKIEALEGIAADRRLRFYFAGHELRDDRTLADSNIQRECTLHLMFQHRGGGFPYYYTNPDCFHPRFNYDFRRLPPDTEQFLRGDRVYQRPIGSRRYALKVLDKYPDGNTWLGESGKRTASSPGEWPVAYHGTHEGNVKDIAEKGLMLANGQRFKFGRGIYCSPDPKTALVYGHEYQFQGRLYKLILQLRVNPAKIRIIPKEETPKDLDEYWVMPGDGDLRAYGICIFEL